MKNISKPWQVVPVKIIELATELIKNKSDFDEKIAYLLIDISVETILKAFLGRNSIDIEYKKFPQIIDEVNKKLSEEKRILLNKKDLMDFHNNRNTLYHQGELLMPMGGIVSDYKNMAQELLLNLLGLDIAKLSEENNFDVVLRIQKNIKSLQSNSSLMVEHRYPQFATRKIEAQLRYIRINTGPDDESYPPSVRAEFVQQRIDAFNKITGWELTEDDYEFIEYIIDNPEQLHVWLAFQEINSNDWREEWKQYQWVVNFLEHEKGRNIAAEDKRIEELYEWTHEKASIIFQWLKDHIPDIEPKNSDLYYPPMIFDP